ncbi:hypothetical protein ACKAV7_003733 [Fusarium commune]
MAKQKNRLTTTRPQNRLARERFAYPAPTLHIQQTVGDETRTLLTLGPTLDHISSESQPGDDKTGLPYTARISFRQCQIRQPGESTSRSIKSKLPTLDLPWTTLTLPALESILEPTMSKQPTYTVQHTAAHDRASQTRRIRITEFHQVPTRLPCTARPETTHRNTHNPYSLQKSGEPIGEIEAKDGLPSADRNNKATLLLTGPFRTAKSSAKDLTPLVLKLQYAKIPRRASSAVEESPAKTLSRSLFLSIYTCGGITAFWHGF